MAISCSLARSRIIIIAKNHIWRLRSPFQPLDCFRPGTNKVGIAFFGSLNQEAQDAQQIPAAKYTFARRKYLTRSFQGLQLIFPRRHYSLSRPRITGRELEIAQPYLIPRQEVRNMSSPYKSWMALTDLIYRPGGVLTLGVDEPAPRTRPPFFNQNAMTAACDFKFPTAP